MILDRSDWFAALPLVADTYLTTSPRCRYLVANPPLPISQSSGCAPIIITRSGGEAVPSVFKFVIFLSCFLSRSARCFGTPVVSQ